MGAFAPPVRLVQSRPKRFNFMHRRAAPWRTDAALRRLLPQRLERSNKPALVAPHPDTKMRASKRCGTSGQAGNDRNAG
jgi:hypothetical protein